MAPSPDMSFGELERFQNSNFNGVKKRTSDAKRLKGDLFFLFYSLMPQLPCNLLVTVVAAIKVSASRAHRLL
jgi:hypothetical protein